MDNERQTEGETNRRPVLLIRQLWSSQVAVCDRQRALSVNRSVSPSSSSLHWIICVRNPLNCMLHLSLLSSILCAGWFTIKLCVRVCVCDWNECILPWICHFCLIPSIWMSLLKTVFDFLAVLCFLFHVVLMSLHSLSGFVPKKNGCITCEDWKMVLMLKYCFSYFKCFKTCSYFHIFCACKTRKISFCTWCQGTILICSRYANIIVMWVLKCLKTHYIL